MVARRDSSRIYHVIASSTLIGRFRKSRGRVLDADWSSRVCAWRTFWMGLAHILLNGREFSGSRWVIRQVCGQLRSCAPTTKSNAQYWCNDIRALLAGVGVCIVIYYRAKERKNVREGKIFAWCFCCIIHWKHVLGFHFLGIIIYFMLEMTSFLLHTCNNSGPWHAGQYYYVCRPYTHKYYSLLHQKFVDWYEYICVWWFEEGQLSKLRLYAHHLFM